MAESARNQIKILPLSQILKSSQGISILDGVLASFKCQKNKDEEDFLHCKAISFETQNKARTYLLYNDDFTHLLGYFTLAFKSIELDDVPKDKRKQMTAGESNVDTYAAFLIGHLAKNDCYKNELNGNILLNEAINIIAQAQDLVGGRLMYIDCKKEAKLMNFYESNGFVWFKTSEKTGLLQYYKKI